MILIVNQNSRIKKLKREFAKAKPDALFSTRQLSDIMNIAESTIERNRWSGKGIPFIRQKHLVFYQKSEVVKSELYKKARKRDLRWEKLLKRAKYEPLKDMNWRKSLES